MTNNFLHGISGLVLTIPFAVGLQHNTRLYGAEIEQATNNGMHYNGWFHVVGSVTPDRRECKTEDLEKRRLFTPERRYTCDLYFEEFSVPASFSIRVSYNAGEDADLVVAMDALKQFDSAVNRDRVCTLRARPYEDNAMVLDTLVCR
jgi:hypothetical protein